MGECRAGLRRYAETDRGDRYQTVLAWDGEGDAAPPKPHERLYGDYIDPTRPGRMMDVVNHTSQLLGRDTAAWSVERHLRMLASATGRFSQSRE